jgi:hypothetical protein
MEVRADFYNALKLNLRAILQGFQIGSRTRTRSCSQMRLNLFGDTRSLVWFRIHTIERACVHRHPTSSRIRS